MTKVFAVARVLFLLPVFASFGIQANAQAVQSLDSIQAQAELDKAITTLDAAVFDAYNRCDLEKFSSFFALQAYHMKGYGAVEMGVHQFHHLEHEDTEPVGEGKFIHLWRYKDGAWKITRVISYDHHAAAK